MAILEEQVEMFLVSVKSVGLLIQISFPFECDIIVITGIGTGVGALGVGG